jgi:predicted nucleic acid-binding protein
MLLDSNIIIYSVQPENQFLRQLISKKVPMVSAVSYVEVLGYHRLSEAEREHFEMFFAEARILPLSPPVLDAAVRIRQSRKIKLGDSLVAGTALLYGLSLVTRNVDDFAGIEGLQILNPFEERI